MNIQVLKMAAPVDHDLSDQQLREFAKSSHSVLAVIHNQTDYDLRFLGTYFSPGNWFVPPPLKIKPNTKKNYYAVKVDFSGVAAGLKFVLNAKPERLYVLIGFTNPFIGCNKSYVRITPDEKVMKSEAYWKASDGKPKHVVHEPFAAKALLLETKEIGGITAKGVQQIVYEIYGDARSSEK